MNATDFATVVKARKARRGRQTWRDVSERVEKRQAVMNSILDKLVRDPDNESLANAFAYVCLFDAEQHQSNCHRILPTAWS